MTKRFDILAQKEGETTAKYKVTYSEVEATIIAWEFRMSGYIVKVKKEEW